VRDPIVSPLTGTSRVEPLQKLDTRTLIRMWKEAFGIDTADEFGAVEEIQKLRCLDSGLMFYRPTQCAGGTRLYRELGRHSWYYMEQKWEYDTVARHLPRQGRLLEVGCGKGFFLRKAVQKGWAVRGLELGAPAETAPQDCEFSITGESVERHAELHPAAYDAVCAFQVLEHVVDPLSFVKACVALLAPGGRLFLGTPNAQSFLKHSFNLLDMPPHHLTGWNKQAFQFLEKILPLKIEKVLYEPLAQYHLDYFIQTYRARFKSCADLRGIWTRGIGHIFAKALLKAGARQWIRGQSMLVAFRKAN